MVFMATKKDAIVNPHLARQVTTGHQVAALRAVQGRLWMKTHTNTTIVSLAPPGFTKTRKGKHHVNHVALEKKRLVGGVTLVSLVK